MATKTEIAKAAWCSEGAVRKAVQRGLDVKDLESVCDFVFRMRVKKEGLSVLDDIEKPFKNMVTENNVDEVLEKHYVPDDEHADGYNL